MQTTQAVASGLATLPFALEIKTVGEKHRQLEAWPPLSFVIAVKETASVRRWRFPVMPKLISSTDREIGACNGERSAQDMSLGPELLHGNPTTSRLAVHLQREGRRLGSEIFFIDRPARKNN